MRWPLALLLALLPAAPAMASAFAAGGNGGAFARSFALPELGRPHVLGARQWEASAVVDVANEYGREGLCGIECLTLDGETFRLRLGYRRGIGDDWDAALELPLLRQGGGFLDEWIEDWHATFGLPNAGREHTARGQYLYEYRRRGATALRVDEEGEGVGDAALAVGRRLGPDAAARALLKLPTGNGAALRGGNGGGALWLDVALPLPPGWSGYLAAGASVNGAGEVLPSMQRRVVPFGGFGLAAPLSARVSFVAQLQAHDRLYDGSALRPLARRGMPLTFGLRAVLGGLALDLGVQEDLSVYGSPDFAVHFALAWRGGAPAS